MEDKELDQLLAAILNTPVEPTDEVIQRTRSRIVKKKGLEISIALSIFFNALAFFGFIYYMIFTLHPWVVKVLLYTVFSGLSNLIILFLYLNREKLTVYCSQHGFIESKYLNAKEAYHENEYII